MLYLSLSSLEPRDASLAQQAGLIDVISECGDFIRTFTAIYEIAVDLMFTMVSTANGARHTGDGVCVSSQLDSVLDGLSKFIGHLKRRIAID